MSSSNGAWYGGMYKVIGEETEYRLYKYTPATTMTIGQNKEMHCVLAVIEYSFPPAPLVN
jgi:hypothetical protein